MIQKPTPIPEWRRAWKLLSVRVGALAIGFGLMPPDMQAAILAVLGVPAERAPAILGVLFILGRITSQPAMHTQDETAQDGTK